MHIHYTHPDFADVFSRRVVHVRRLVKKHPVLSQKEEILTQISAQNIDDLSHKIARFLQLLEQEKPLWRNIRIELHKSPYGFVEASVLHKPEAELHSDDAQFVKTHFQKVKEYFPGTFDKLHTAAISEGFEHRLHQRDYWLFQQAVDAITQLERLQEHITHQEYLAKLISTKLNQRAHAVHEDVVSLRESHDGQIAYLSRLPPFSFSLK